MKTAIAILLAAGPALAQYEAPKLELTKYTFPKSGHVRIFSGDDLRKIVGDQRYEEFSGSGQTLNAWIEEQNAESFALTLGEIASFALAAATIGGAVALDLDQNVRLGLAGGGVVFAGVGVALVWADTKDYGTIWHPELEPNWPK